MKKGVFRSQISTLFLINYELLENQKKNLCFSQCFEVIYKVRADSAPPLKQPPGALLGLKHILILSYKSMWSSVFFNKKYNFHIFSVEKC